MKNKITYFDRHKISLLRKEIQIALDRISKKYGLSELELKNISFNENCFNAKLVAALPEYQELQKRNSVEDAKYFALQNNLPEDLLNKTFISNGKIHTIIRIETKNPKFPVITKCTDGRSYKFSPVMIKEILERFSRDQLLLAPHIKIIDK